MKKSTKKIVGFIVLFLITGIVLYFSLKDNFSSVMHQIASMNVFWLFFAFFLLNAYFFYRSIVTVKFARNFNPNYKLWSAFKMEWEIVFFNAITPFSTGGKPYEIYALNQNDLELVDAANVSIQNFIVYQLALVLLGLFALIYNHTFNIFERSNLLTQLVILGFLANTLVIVLLFFVTFARKSNKFILNFIINILSKLRIVKDKEKKKKELEKYLSEFHDGATNLLKNKWQFVEIIFLHFIALVCLYLIPIAILYGMGDYTSLNGLTSVFASAYVMLIGSFVPMPGGTGGIEYIFLIFYGNFIKGSRLNALMLLWRFITFYLGVVVGAILVFRGKKEQ